MKTTTQRAFFPLTACLFAALSAALYGRMPQVHAAISPQLVSIPCTSPKACAAVSNSGAGPAITGTATNTSGITGSTAALNAPFTTVNGLTFGLTGGIVGYDTAPLSPLVGAGNTGVVGVSLYSTGMFGVSYNAFNYGAGTDVTTFGAVPAVFGLDAGPNTGIDGSGNVGIAGRSLTRVGGLFLSKSGYGAVGRSFTGTGVLGVGRAAGAIALAATSLAGGPLFIGKSGNTQVATLDSSGNLLLAGNIRTGDTTQFMTKSTNGASVVTYAGRQSMASVEDFGQVQMRGGVAVVQLDPAFARIIDPQRTYLVFVTPEGDSRGVYVTNKTANGFIVRESAGGRSSLALSYRIIAHAFGANDARFTVAPAASKASAANTAPRPAAAFDKRLVNE